MEDQEAVGVACVLILKLVYDRNRQFGKEDNIHLKEIAQNILRHPQMRNFVSKKETYGFVVLMMLEILHMDIDDKIIDKKLYLQSMKARSKEENDNFLVLNQKNLKILENMAKMLYNFDIAKPDCDIGELMLIYLKLGDIHLQTYPLRSNYFSEEEELEYDFLVIKRRVLHNYLVEDVLEKAG